MKEDMKKVDDRIFEIDLSIIEANKEYAEELELVKQAMAAGDEKIAEGALNEVTEKFTSKMSKLLAEREELEAKKKRR